MIHQNAYALRSCKAGGISPYDRTFTWNLEIGGITTAPDWENSPACGHGLHGFLNGEGRGDLACWDKDAVWLVLRPIGEIVDLDGKIKFKSAETLFVGIRQEAAAHLQSLLGSEDATKCLIIGGTATAGDSGTATAGDSGTATAGDRGTIVIRWWDGNRYRLAVGYVGEDGIEPNQLYRVEAGKLMKVEEGQ
jgi:hypothetical protein